MTKQKTLVCQLGSQEMCVERDSIFNPDCKVFIKDLPGIKRKSDRYIGNLENADYGSSTESTDEGESSCVSSGRNSPIRETWVAGHATVDNGIKSVEESENSSGYESGYVTPNRHTKKKRKLSLLASHIEKLKDTEHAKIHKPQWQVEHPEHIEKTESIEFESPESSDVESPEVDSTCSEEVSTSDNEEQHDENNVHCHDKTDVASAQEIIQQFSKTLHEIPIEEPRDQEVSSTGVYLNFSSNNNTK